MITAYLLRAVLIGGLVGLAAMLAEYVLASLGRATRFVWIAALALGTTIPLAGVIGARVTDGSDAISVAGIPWAAGTPGDGVERGSPHAASGARDAAGRSAGNGMKVPGAGKGVASGEVRSPVAVRHGGDAGLTIPGWLAAFDDVVVLLWAGAALMWGAILSTSAFRLHRNRTRWRESMLDGMPVYMSHDVGPALFGLTRFGIVVPAWVTELPLEHRRLIVAHEREHARAGDPVTLLGGALLVLLQPLNPAVWAMFRRLRLAIEIDCDARVLAGAADARMYGELLLDVGERTLTGAAPVAALSEGGAQLERRIVAMSRPGRRHSVVRAVAAGACAGALVIAVWKVPLPAVASAQAVARDVAPAAPGAGTLAESAAPARPVMTAIADTIRDPARRAIIRVHRLGLHNASATPEILVWAVGGPVQVGVADGPMRLLTDTLRLDRLPALRFDVTEGHAFIRLVNGGTMSLGADAEGGGAQQFTVQAAQVAFLRGGHGVAHGDDLPERLDAMTESHLDTLDDAVLRRILEERYPGLLDVAGPAEYVWLLVDDQDRVLQSNRGLGDLPRRGDGQLASLDDRVARTMLPAMEPGVEGYGWRRMPANNGGTINVMWVRQRSRAASTGGSPRDAVRAERAAAREDVARLAEERFAALFAGIRLTPAAAMLARSIVLEEYFDEFDYPPHKKGLRDVLVIQERRDARLAGMLEARADRERFRRNAGERRAWEFRNSQEYQRRFGSSSARGGRP